METLSANAGIKSLKFNGYKIELCKNRKDFPVAKLFRFITVGKNKGTYRHIEGYYFANEVKRNEWIEKQMKAAKELFQQTQGRRDAKKQARETMVNPYFVGQILYSSWGYDQTNVDYYEVVKVGNKSVELQEIGSNQVDGSGYGMSCKVVPNPELKEGQPFQRNVKVYIGCDNKPNYSLNDKYGHHNLYEYTKENKGLYRSWYA